MLLCCTCASSRDRSGRGPRIGCPRSTRQNQKLFSRPQPENRQEAVYCRTVQTTIGQKLSFSPSLLLLVSVLCILLLPARRVEDSDLILLAMFKSEFSVFEFFKFWKRIFEWYMGKLNIRGVRLSDSFSIEITYQPLFSVWNLGNLLILESDN